VGVLLLAACSGSSGVLVQASWDPGLTVDALDVRTTVAGGAPADKTLTADVQGAPMHNPYKLLVSSPPAKSVNVRVQARSGGALVATGELDVTPGHGEVLQVALHLEATPPPRCGDGNLDANEECDDGNREDRDGCTNACTCARCGDGILHAFDAAPPNGMCAAAPVEQCDDGNNVSGDGCSATCTRE
jgi:cysteine-rich repeat protein